MASTNAASIRKSYMPLSVKPVEYSLTAGTNIPAPLDSPPASPASAIRPPTPGGGPLTSHPTTPDEFPGAFPPTPDPETDIASKIPSSHNHARQIRTDSFRTPMSPASASQTTTSSPEPQRRPSGVRKLLSLSSLRSSFGSSRTSLSIPRASHDIHQQPQQTNGVKRPSSPSIISTTASSYRQGPELRHKKSGNWFKRKSGMFMTNAEMINGDALHEEDENQRPDTRESKRFKESSPAPLLPEIRSFGGGELGWDEQFFKR